MSVCVYEYLCMIPVLGVQALLRGAGGGVAKG